MLALGFTGFGTGSFHSNINDFGMSQGRNHLLLRQNLTTSFTLNPRSPTILGTCGCRTFQYRFGVFVLSGHFLGSHFLGSFFLGSHFLGSFFLGSHLFSRHFLGSHLFSGHFLSRLLGHPFGFCHSSIQRRIRLLIHLPNQTCCKHACKHNRRDDADDQRSFPFLLRWLGREIEVLGPHSRGHITLRDIIYISHFVLHSDACSAFFFHP